MRYQIPCVRAGTWRARRIAPAVLTMMLLTASVLLAPRHAWGGIIRPTAGPTRKGDDIHTANTNPYLAGSFKPIPVSTITYAGHPELNGECTWINTGLNAFVKANPNWSYDWAGVSLEEKAEAGIKILDYYPYVVTKPSVTTAPGSNPTPANPNGAYVFGAKPPGEYGGAVLNLQYNKQPGVPMNNLHWIQALTGTLWGHALPPILDNDVTPYHAFVQQSTVSPYYGSVKNGALYNNKAAGKLAGGGGYFEDRPYIPEFDSYWSHKEYESNPVASIQFQVVLADEKDLPGGKHQLTLYGGEWWGFTYSAQDIPTPEPSSCLLMILGGGGLVFFRRMTGWMPAA